MDRYRSYQVNSYDLISYKYKYKYKYEYIYIYIYI